jgi:hypothetical protein
VKTPVARAAVAAQHHELGIARLIAGRITTTSVASSIT